MSNPSDRTDATRAEGPPKRETPSEPAEPKSLVGVVLSGRYLMERLIGEGGMGAVYQAEHTHMHKRLAVKVLHPEMSHLPEVVARFEREAMVAAHIEHPNVAAATDFGKLDDGSFFLVLEYVEGRGLRDVIKEGRFELGRALHVARQIASALARAHSLGIVHRDLKPENVMLVVREEDADFVKVLDFGIAKVSLGELTSGTKAPGQVLTQLGMVYGTPEYMAPEQALGQPVDARADLYALGVMLFEMVTGSRPYDHESKVTLLGMHVTAPVPSMRQRLPEALIPEEVDGIVTRLLAKDATARFDDAKGLIDALDAAADDLAARGLIAEPLPPTSLVQPSRANRGEATGPRSALALGPTSFAQPSADAAPRFVSVVGTTLSNALKAAPPWMTPRRVLLAACGLGALTVLWIAAVARSGAGVAPTGSASGAAVVLPPRPPDPKVDEIVQAAQVKIDKGDFATAIDEITAVEKKHTERSDVHMLLERAYTGVHNTHEAMREAGLWLTADASASFDPKLEEDVRNAALVREGQDDAFALLQSKMGTRGIDILYDIAYGASGRQYPQAAARAHHVLDLPEVRNRASAGMSLLLDFRDAKTCEAKHSLLERARDQGDARLIAVLQPYESTRGCGFLGVSDCYPCMHRDKQLRDAVSAIEERASKGAP
jgi:eukaryotic-like serine/threonine-protein kinase